MTKEPMNEKELRESVIQEILEECLDAVEYVGTYNSHEREQEARMMVKEAIEKFNQFLGREK